MNPRVLFVALAAGVLASVASPVLADQAPAPPPPDQRLGIAEAFRRPDVAADLRVGWERLIIPWNQVQPNGPGDFSKLGQTLTPGQLQGELARGTRITGLLQFTPSWAAQNPADGQRSVPKNLYLAYDDPNNYWGQFVYNTVKYYGDRGLINDWVLWNEPEFKPGDSGAGGSFTWLGSEQDFAQLTKVGYLAAKKANPKATVSFAATSYWDDALATPPRPQFYDRVLAIIKQDPDAAKNNYYHDAVSLNLYRAPDDIYRVYSIFKGIQQKYGIDKPVWLTETNAMPADDTSIACAAQQTQNAFVKTTMDQQSAYAVQALALGAAAGYGRMEVYQMVDDNTCAQPAVWGVTRDDGSRRPIAQSLKTAFTYMAGYTKAQFVPLLHLDSNVCQPSCWPNDPNAYVTNNEIYQVALDRPNNERVTVLWNGDGQQNHVSIKQNGTSAVAVDKNGNVTPLQPDNGWWEVDLAPATAYFKINDQIKDPDGYHYIGGDPVMIVEEGVDPSTPVQAPVLGDATTIPSGFQANLDPADGQTIQLGSAADYTLTTRGTGGFTGPITLSVQDWSTQRFPQAQDPSTLLLNVTMPQQINPGDTATIHVDSSGATDPGIYYVDVQLQGGGVSQTETIALVLNP